MKKKIVGFFVSSLLIFIIIPLSAFEVRNEYNLPASLDGNILYVGGNGPNNYTRIQDAIDDASDGDTVFVYNVSSPYYENIVINKSINLLGEERNNTVIDGYYLQDIVIYISDDWVNISGFTIQGGELYGIYIISNNTTVQNNIILYNWCDGLYLDHSYNNNVTDNIFLNNWCAGIYLDYSNCNTVGSNSLFNGNSVGLSNSNNNTIIGNIILKSDVSGIGIWNSKNNLIKANNILNGSYWGIKISNANKNTVIENNILSNYKFGIFFDHSSNYNIIYHNNFKNNNQNAYDEFNNTWDDSYPSGGNYWDDYTGEDKNGDGIGDIPYNISGGNNQDRYPLMEPWVYITPIAKFNWKPRYPNTNKTIIFNASKSLDYDGNITLYEWDWDNDGEFDENHTNFTATYSWLEYGYYPVTLRITDNDNLTESKTNTIRVGNFPPYAQNITGPSYGRSGINYTFCIKAFDPEEDNLYCIWFWGDGASTGWLGPFPSGQMICASHAWQKEGTYTIRAKLKDEYDNEIEVSHNILIEDRPPYVKISRPKRAVYIHDKAKIPFLVPVIFGDIQIWFGANDNESGLDYVELYIDKELKETFDSIPKSWTWDEKVFFRHTIKIIAYDNAGNYALKQKTVWKFF